MGKKMGDKFPDMLEAACRERGWPAPVLACPEEPDEREQFVAQVTVNLGAQSVIGRGGPSGWRAACIRHAYLDALHQVAPSYKIPEAWRAPVDIRFNAPRHLYETCHDRALGLPNAFSVSPSNPDFPDECEVRIHHLPDHVFRGFGFGYSEAKAAASTKALAVVERLPKAHIEPLRVAGRLEDLRETLFVSTGPGGWIHDLTNALQWPKPSFEVQVSGTPPALQFVVVGTLDAPGRVLTATSAPHITKQTAFRDAALQLMRQAAPDLIIPPEVTRPPHEHGAMGRLIEYGTVLKLGNPIIKNEHHAQALLPFRCSITLPNGKQTWYGQDFSASDARAEAATYALKDLKHLVEQRKSSNQEAQRAQKEQAAAKAAAQAAAKNAAERERKLREALTAAELARQQPVKPPVVTTLGPSVSKADAALRASVTVLGLKNKLSLRTNGCIEWDLRLDTGIVLTLSALPNHSIKLVGARSKKGDELLLPERVKNRSISLDLSGPALANSMREHFIHPLEGVNPSSKPLSEPPSPTPATVTIARLVAEPTRSTLRKEIEADPFVKSSSGFFREGFLAHIDNEGSECPWTLDTLRKIDWTMGYDYAGLVCSDCGAQNRDGARCHFPEPDEDPEVVEPLAVRARVALARLNASSAFADDVVVIQEALDLLEALTPASAPSEKTQAPTFCLKCTRRKEKAKGRLCLNPGFALRELESLDVEHSIAPYHSVKLYGLRRRPKADFWAYVVVTNGTLAQCVDEDIVPYRGTEELIERAVLTEATLNPSRRLKL